MPVLGAATLELNADSAKLEQDLGRAVQNAAAFGTAVGQVMGQAISAGINKLEAMVTQAIDTGDELNKLSQKTGMSVENLSELRVAAQLADVSMNTLKTSVRGLYESISQAGRGKGEKNQAFEAIGLDIEKLKGLKPDELFRTVTERLSQYGDSMERAVIQTKIFGKSGAELSPFINELTRTTAMARQLGITMDTDTAAAAERFKDNMTVGKIASEAMGMRIAQVLLPSLEKLSGFMVENAKNTERLDTVTRAADGGLKILATGVTIVGTAFEIVGGQIGRMAAVFGAVVRGDFKAAAGLAKDTFADVGTAIGEAAGKIHNIWEETGNRVAAGAEANGKKLAAPALAAAEKVKKARKEISEELQHLFAVTDLRAKAGKEMEEVAAESDKFQRSQSEAYAKMVESFDLLRQGRGGDFEEMYRPIEKVAEKTKQANTFARDMGLTFESAFEKAVAGGEKLSVVFKGLLQDIGKIVLRKTVTEPLGNAISGMLSNVDWGSIFSARAEGGPVSSGTPYLVGERGPELFVPNSSGSVVPNGAFGGGGFVANIYAPGADAAQLRRVEAELHQLHNSLEARALGAMRSARVRGMG